MPSDLFIYKVRDKKLIISLMEEVSLYFNVSRLVAFLKYVPIGSYSIQITGVPFWSAELL
jgi:hypothetical protein